MNGRSNARCANGRDDDNRRNRYGDDVGEVVRVVVLLSLIEALADVAESEILLEVHLRNACVKTMCEVLLPKRKGGS